jgi:hypothetical protein
MDSAMRGICYGVVGRKWGGDVRAAGDVVFMGKTAAILLMIGGVAFRGDGGVVNNIYGACSTGEGRHWFSFGEACQSPHMIARRFTVSGVRSGYAGIVSKVPRTVST